MIYMKQICYLLRVRWPRLEYVTQTRAVTIAVSFTAYDIETATRETTEASL